MMRFVDRLVLPIIVMLLQACTITPERDSEASVSTTPIPTAASNTGQTQAESGPKSTPPVIETIQKIASATADTSVKPEQSITESTITAPTITEPASKAVINLEDEAAILKLCTAIGKKLGSVDFQDCQQQHLQHSALSPEGYSLAYKDYPPLPGKSPLGKVLLIGGIHGDEYSSVSIVFKWMDILDQHHSGLYHWRVIPTANPDGLLRKKSQRQNSRGVDLNRNFPTRGWRPRH